MKINIKNTEKLESALAAAQARAKVRTVDADDIRRAALAVKNRLGIPRCRMVGITANVDLHADIYPGAYKGTPESTQFTLAWTASGCFVTDISRRDSGGTRKCYSVRLTDQAQEAIMENHQRF